MPDDVNRQKWLPVETKQCPDCKYKKHPNGMYDKDDQWPHWCYPK